MEKETHQDTKKVTTLLPMDLLRKAQLETGQGITETITEGLRRLVRARAGKEISKLRGKVEWAVDIDALREDRDE